MSEYPLDQSDVEYIVDERINERLNRVAVTLEAIIERYAAKLPSIERDATLCALSDVLFAINNAIDGKD